MKSSVAIIAVSILSTSFIGGYFAYKHFSPQIESMTEQKTRKILQEVKHQMLMSCVNFTSEMKKKQGRINLTDPQTMVFLRGEMTKIYQQKEALVLNKHGYKRESYNLALKKYGKVKFVKESMAEIFEIMEKAISGRIPNLSVTPEAKAFLSKQNLSELYFEISKIIALQVYDRLTQKLRDDPSFDCSDDESFRQAIRSLSIYDFKVKFLKGKGFQEVWGCPNQVFYKLLESYKIEDGEFNIKLTKIEKAYEKAIEEISHDPTALSKQSIDEYFRESDPKKVEKKQLSEKPIVQAKIQLVAPPAQQPSYLISKDQVDSSQKPMQVNVLTSIKYDPEEKAEENSDVNVVQENANENKEEGKAEEIVEVPSEEIKEKDEASQVAEERILVDTLLEKEAQNTLLEKEAQIKEDSEKVEEKSEGLE